MKAVCGLFVYAATCVALSAPPTLSVPTGKLLREVLPRHYALDFRVDPTAAGFSATAQIDVELREPVDRLWMHGRGLSVDKVTWTDAAGVIHVASWRIAAEDPGVAELTLGQIAAKGQIRINFDYHATFNARLEGLYKASHNGKAYIVSQMEPISARRAFPGFDEPSFKTPFDISVQLREADKAFSNTPVESEQALAEGWRRLRFRTTPALPTYLVALAVGPWDVVDGPTVPASALRDHTLPLRGVAVQGQGERVRESLQATPAIITALEDYFGYPYSFGKMDLVAAPDFSAGAMENPGMIVFKDRLLLLDANTPSGLRRDVFNVNVHELAHQWFGDTVTMPWWDDIWLNEAFASWMQGKITAQLRPDYRADLRAVIGAQEAMRTDSLSSARRIRQAIVDSGDILGAFDSITYRKGAAVLGMFEAYLGADTFRAGIRNYVAGHAFGTATADDLVTALARSADQGARFEAAMKSFLDQPGVPILSTQLSCKAGKASLGLSQQRYFPLGSIAPSEQHWGIPVCLRLGYGDRITTQCELFDKAATRVDLPEGCPDWYQPNAASRGYYRYRMPAEDLQRLRGALAKLDEAEQLGYADAISAAFDSGKVDASTVLDAMRDLAASPTREVAIALLPKFVWIRDHLADAAMRKVLDAYAERLYLPRLQTLGYRAKSGEPELDALLRADLAEFLSRDANSAVVRTALLRQARELLDKDTSGRLQFAKADADLLGSVLLVAVQELGAEAIDALMADVELNADPFLRASSIAALGATTDPELGDRVRDYALGTTVKVGEMAGLLGVNQARPENRQAFWTWLQRHYAAVVARTPVFAQGKLPEAVSDGWCDVSDLPKFGRFFSSHADAIDGGRLGAERARESIQLCDALRKHHGAEALRRWSRAQPVD